MTAPVSVGFNRFTVDDYKQLKKDFPEFRLRTGTYFEVSNYSKTCMGCAIGACALVSEMKKNGRTHEDIIEDIYQRVFDAGYGMGTPASVHGMVDYQHGERAILIDTASEDFHPLYMRALELGFEGWNKNEITAVVDDLDDLRAYDPTITALFRADLMDDPRVVAGYEDGQALREYIYQNH